MTRGTPSFTNQTLSATSHKLAFGFIAEATTTINALGLRLAAQTGTSPTYQVEIQGLDGLGMPDGVGLVGSSATFNPASLGWTANTFRWIPITGVNLTRGNPYAMVVRYSSGTIDASNNASFSANQTAAAPESIGLPYPMVDTGTGWTKSALAGEPIFGYRSPTQTFGSPFQGWITGSLSTNGQRAALKLMLDSDWGQLFSVRGLMLQFCPITTGGTAKVGIWNAAGTELASCTLDTDHTGLATSIKQLRAFFSAAPLLNFGTPYYYGIERVATSTLSPRYLEVCDNRDLEAYPFGSSAVLSTWNGSTWTDVLTQTFPVTLLFDSWTIPPASGPAPIIMG
jgi:hypothetical protein